jgi:hypothetical protein
MATSRTFRSFVSSTFSDLKVERNALQERVFPRLRELCERHGCRFQAIDLRWGVNEEAALDQRTMRICLVEIARCQHVTPRPNFIVLVGNRYGWRPLPYEIEANEFEKILAGLSNTGNAERLTYWYRKDENADPSVYVLQPRTDEFTEFAAWEKEEGRLRELLIAATAGLPVQERMNYVASATEQDIWKGTSDDVPVRVDRFRREPGSTRRRRYPCDRASRQAEDLIRI